MIKKVLTVLAATCILTSCYEDYLRDFDYTAAYIAYQYDLRTFVAGEDEAFTLPVALGGVMVNEENRAYSVSIDDNLCSQDLRLFSEGKYDEFNALDGMLGKAQFGMLAGGSNSYVTTEVGDAGISELVPLPKDYYSVDFSGLSIPVGYVTASSKIKASSKFFDDPKAYKPYYAVAYKIDKADVDSLIKERGFSVVAVKAENKFFGNWYHGGMSKTGENEILYPLHLPQDDNSVYTLTTVDKNTVKTNKYVQNSGSLTLTFNGDDITITSDDVTLAPDSRKSYFNGAKLLQDRVLYLNYSYVDNKGRTIQVSDSLMFRNRIRDGINEWQDTNVEHYK